MNNSTDKVHEIGVAGFMVITFLAGCLFGLGVALVEYFTLKPIEVRYTHSVMVCDSTQTCEAAGFTILEPLTKKPVTMSTSGSQTKQQ